MLSNTTKYILIGVILLIIIITIILFNIYLKRKNKDKASCSTKCAIKSENDEEVDDADDCKCAV